ncbi:MAG TPA: ThiF family adenylyltransferase [Phycisphaerae bacterium]|nr:ThiF family adenylyltransferase [Phycisphaerae bacterium]
MTEAAGPGIDPQDRYSRQMLYERIGLEGQRRLGASRVVLVGCGALGSMIADTLVRAGVGHLRICDRDFVELDNLQRQVLFDEDDVRANLPKAEAARRKLRRINSQVSLEVVVSDVNHTNVERHVEGADLLLDGTDNFETRYLINDLAVRDSIPWVYGAVIGATGLCLPIVPGETPCLRCVFESPPPPEMTPTCDTVGVLAPAVSVVAALECIEGMKVLTGRLEEVNRGLVSIDLWTGRWVRVNVGGAADATDCPCCRQRRFEYLDGSGASTTTHLCGRNAVQVNRAGGPAVDLAAIAARLKRVCSAPVTFNRFLLRAYVEDCELTLFGDGRAIIKGTDDADRARVLYSKYVGV